MRAADAAEIAATRWTLDPVALAREVVLRPDFSWVAGAGEPIACIGAAQVWPHVFEAWMFATDRFPLIGKRLTLWVKHVMMPAVTAAGAHRVHCHSAEAHTEAHAWLEALGAVHESSKPMFGQDGQTFRVYRWLADV